MKIDKDTLYKEYIVNLKSMKEIAKEYSISVGTVYNYIKKYGIKSRKPMNEITKQNISNALKGKESKNKGKKRTPEQIERIRLGKLNKYRKPSTYGGHKKKRTDGYIKVYLPTHPNSTKDGYVMEHILIMENKIGRYLKSDEVVHHINRIRNDNRIENLKLMTFKEHARLHMIERHKKRKGVMTYQ